MDDIALALVVSFYALLSICVIVINALVLVVTNKGNCVSKNVNSIYIVSLSIADLLTGISSIIVIVADMVEEKYFPCIIGHMLTNISIPVSVYTLLQISVVQYIALAYPKRWMMGFAKWSCIGLWTFFFILIISLYIFLNPWSLDIQSCTIMDLFETNLASFNVSGGTTLSLCIIFIVIVNGKTILLIRSRMKKTNATSTAYNTRELFTIAPLHRRQKQDWKVLYKTQSLRPDCGPSSSTSQNYSNPVKNQDLDIFVVTGREDEIAMSKSNDETIKSCTMERVQSSNNKFVKSEITPIGKSKKIEMRRNPSADTRNASVRHVELPAQNVIRKSNPYKPFITLLTLILVFLFMIGPFSVFITIRGLCPSCVHDEDVRLFRSFLGLSVILNSLVNPIIYSFRIKPYHDFMKDKMNACCTRVRVL